jgi:hypothetical protein
LNGHLRPNILYFRLKSKPHSFPHNPKSTKSQTTRSGKLIQNELQTQSFPTVDDLAPPLDQQQLGKRLRWQYPAGNYSPFKRRYEFRRILKVQNLPAIPTNLSKLKAALTVDHVAPPLHQQQLVERLKDVNTRLVNRTHDGPPGVHCISDGPHDDGSGTGVQTCT